MIRLWLRGLVGARSGRLIAAVAGLALTVVLLGSLGAFVVASSENMARRAVASVPGDRQVLVASGVDPATVIDAIGKATPYNALQPVEYADTAGFSAATGGSLQTTGPGKGARYRGDYREHFPGQIQLDLGSWDGVLIAAQTAANLHVAPGDTVTIQRIGLGSLDVKIVGVVALPNADSMFQAIGLPKGVAPKLLRTMCCSCRRHSGFDAMAHSWIIRFLEHRIADKRILCLIAKWLRPDRDSAVPAFWQVIRCQFQFAQCQQRGLWSILIGMVTRK